MKTTILFTILFLNCIQFSIAQKLTLTYKIKTNDTVLIFQDKVFSDKTIEANAQNIFRKNVPNPDILSIEDDFNREFIKLESNHEIYYVKLLNKGFYSLYESNLNSDSRYYACSKTDTIVLEKNDLLASNEVSANLDLYKNLASISKNFPELWLRAKTVKFEKKEIQKFISELNSKYSEASYEIHNKGRFDYVSFSLKGMVLGNRTDIIFDVTKSHYFIGDSPNISLKYGIRTNFYKRTEFIPAFWTGYFLIHNGITDSLFVYRDHYETLTAKIIEFPFAVNFEITNSGFTPYFYTGLAPTVYFREISATNSEHISKTTKASINAFAAGGLKLKLTDSFNIMSECRYDLTKGLNFLIGVEYFLHSTLHLPK